MYKSIEATSDAKILYVAVSAEVIVSLSPYARYNEHDKYCNKRSFNINVFIHLSVAVVGVVVGVQKSGSTL